MDYLSNYAGLNSVMHLNNSIFLSYNKPVSTHDLCFYEMCIRDSPTADCQTSTQPEKQFKVTTPSLPFPANPQSKSPAL